MASVSGKNFIEWMESIKSVHYSSKEKMDRAIAIIQDTDCDERPFWIRSE